MPLQLANSGGSIGFVDYILVFSAYEINRTILHVIWDEKDNRKQNNSGRAKALNVRKVDEKGIQETKKGKGAPATKTHIAGYSPQMSTVNKQPIRN